MKTRPMIVALALAFAVSVASASSANAGRLLGGGLLGGLCGCGCDVAPSCGCEAAEPSCGCEAPVLSCGCGLLNKVKGILSNLRLGCGCGCDSEPSCGCEPTCGCS